MHFHLDPDPVNVGFGEICGFQIRLKNPGNPDPVDLQNRRVTRIRSVFVEPPIPGGKAVSAKLC
jgi:hypothetical protein